MRHRLVLEYDGTGFAGWQRQAQGERTVQGVLEAAIASVTGARAPATTGAGRTDAGVHAEGQVVSLDLESRLSPEELGRALNAHLPRDLAVIEVARVGADFHARYGAKRKRYDYRVWNHPVRSPLRERRAYWLPSSLDLAAMREAAGELVGRHDFRSFQAAGSGVEDTVRELFRLSVEGSSPGEVRFLAEGSGFLRHMVRNVVGTLLEVGRGQREASDLPRLLEARDRSQAGPTAPAHGLTLLSVDYGNVPESREVTRESS